MSEHAAAHGLQGRSVRLQRADYTRENPFLPRLRRGPSQKSDFHALLTIRRSIFLIASDAASPVKIF